MTGTVPEFLTPVEHEALKLSGQLANILGRVVGNGPPRTTDLNELLTAVHVIQHAVLANAAGRRYPDLYRTMGEGRNEMGWHANDDGTKSG